MDLLFIFSMFQLTFFSLLALYFKSKPKIIISLLIGIIISWYIGIYRVEIFNDIAWNNLKDGIGENAPSDGASRVFSLYFGWIPGLLYSCALFLSVKIITFLVLRKSGKIT